MTEIPPDLISAYESTDFRVLEPEAFTLRIGQQSDKLQALFHASGANCAAFLTAWNPYSEQTTDAENERLQSELTKRLLLEGFVTARGLGADPSGEWPGEESLFVLGLDLARAKSFGQQFRQNAIVWADADAVPRLVLLR